MSALEIRPVTPAVGAEIHGVDLRAPLCAEHRAEIYDALLKHLVVFLPGQAIELGDFKSFASGFGALTRHVAVDGPPGHPEVMRLHADRNSKWVAGEGWHADLTCNADPPAATVIHLRTVPEVGGDTMFANMYAAYEGLSPRMKAYVEGLEAVHDGNPLFKSIFPSSSKVYPSNTHPVVGVHPETGKKMLFVNPVYTTHIVGVGRSESELLLQALFQQINNPVIQMRYRWKAETIAFWDNRCAQHQAIWDYFPQTRSGFRVQIQSMDGARSVPMDARNVG